MTEKIAIIGAGSTVARMLRQVWDGRDAVWLTRSDWQAGDGADALRPLIADAAHVICLAGVTTSRTGSLDANVAIGHAVARAIPDGAHLYLASSQAVYGPAPGPHHEDDRVAPANPYAVSKLAMEFAVRGQSRVTCLRLGNVVGADVLGRNLAGGQAITLDQFSDGTTPRRSYIDPVSLARAFDALMARTEAGDTLPDVLNIARGPALAMGDIVRAAGATPALRPAPEGALAEVTMDCRRLFDMVPDLAAPVTADSAVAAWHSVRP